MRVQGWESMMAEYIQRQARTPFCWGESDCLTFVADAALMMTGKDPAEEVRGKYTDRTTATKYFMSMQKTPAETMNNYFKRIRPAFAQRGDIVIKTRPNDEQGFTFGMVWDGKAVYRTDGSGLIYEPVREAETAWRVE